MANARFAWGIDIGNRALKAVKLVREGDALRVDDFEVIEHETVLSNAGDNRESLIQTSLANFVQRHSVKGGAVSVGVSGQSSFARFIKLPPVEPSKIGEIVRFEAIQQIPFPLDDVEWSYQLFQDPTSPDVEVGIFAMRKDLVNRQIQYFTDVDMDVQVVQMNPLAVYNAMAYDRKIYDGTTMIVDLGAENTDLIIADGETIWLRSIPIGGNNFTETLVKSFKLNFTKAEDLKRTAATSKYARQIFQAMRPVFADLVAEIQRSIGFYASVHRDARIQKIIALGGTFRLPGLQKYLQQNLQLDVERIDSIGAGAPPDPKLAAAFNENLLSSVSAYGLAVQAMGEGKINSSLLPLAIRREKLWREKTKWFAAAAALFVVGTAIGFGRWYMDNLSFDSQGAARATVQQVMTDAGKYSTDWKAIEAAGSSDRALIANIKSLESYRHLEENITTAIHASLPKPQWGGGADSDKALAEAMKLTPRGERTQITIDSITTQYFADLTVALGSTANGGAGVSPPTVGPGMGMGPGMGPGGMGPGGMMPPGMGPPQAPQQPAAAPTAAATESLAGKRGYIITIEGTTPNRTGFALINGEFVAKLLGFAPSKAQPRMEFKFEKAWTESAQPFANSQSRLTKLATAYNARVAAAKGIATPTPQQPGGGMMIPPGGGMPQPDWRPGGGTITPDPAVNAEADAAAPFLDPLTGEDMRQDWEFQVKCIVLIDPAPYAAPVTAGQKPEGNEGE